MHSHMHVILGTLLIVAVISSPAVTFAVSNESNSSDAFCQSTGKKSANGLALVECCWYIPVKPGTGYKGGDTEMYCSECENGGSRGYISCSEPELQFRTAPTTDESIFPNNDGVAEDQQTEQPSIKSNQGIILEERTIETDSQQNPSFNEEKETSLESTKSENPPSSSETSGSEQTTNFAQKGNGQNSPVPPECPKQGPIPPNCTMKPKF